MASYETALHEQRIRQARLELIRAAQKPDTPEIVLAGLRIKLRMLIHARRHKATMAKIATVPVNPFRR